MNWALVRLLPEDAAKPIPTTWETKPCGVWPRINDGDWGQVITAVLFPGHSVNEAYEALQRQWPKCNIEFLSPKPEGWRPVNW